MAKTYGNFTDFIDFSRASSGTALRKVSYGAELIDTANTASAWTAYGTNTVEQDGDAVKITYVSDSKGAYIYMDEAGGLSSDMAVGKTYRLTFQAKINTGNATVSLYDGAGNHFKNISSTSYVSVAHNFVYPSGSRPYLYIASNLGSGETIWFKGISVKEVTFDQADGTLELFNHPAGIPRIEYDANGNEIGLLIEEQRTNLIKDSNDPTTSNWGTKTTVATKNITGPDGVANSAWTLEDNDAAGYSQNGTTVTVPDDTSTHTASLFILKDSDETRFPELQLTLSGGVALNHYVAINTKTGVTDVRNNGSSATHNVEDCGTFWRVSFGIINNGTGNTNLTLKILPAVFTSLGGSPSSAVTGSIGFYGAQLEQGSFPTSYIPTSGATATRSADIASIDVANFGYNQKAGTLVVEAKRFGTNNYPRTVMVDNNTEAESIGLGAWGTDTAVTGYVVDNGVVQAALGTGVVGTSSFKNALAYKENNFAACRDGGTPITDSAGTVPQGVDTVRFGKNANNNQFFNGHIKSIKYRPRRNSNTQLQEFTS